MDDLFSLRRKLIKWTPPHGTYMCISCYRRHEERKRAMEDHINMTRKGGNGAKWDEHFKTLLLLLLETLGDKDVCYHYKCTSIL